jgi:hypothetical protein
MTPTNIRPELTIVTRLPLKIAVAAAGLLALSACASVPMTPPSAELQAAQLAIANAEQANAAEHAPAELSLAREQLASARIQVQQEHMVTAQRMAVEARAGAELASARTEAAKANAVNAEMQKSTDAMKHEMQRNSGAK